MRGEGSDPGPRIALFQRRSSKDGYLAILSILSLVIALCLLSYHFELWNAMGPAQVLRTDFPAFYIAGREVGHGGALQIYNVSLSEALHRQLGATCCLNTTFVNPPAAAYLLVPFVMSGLETSYFLWSALGICCGLFAVALVAVDFLSRRELPTIYVVAICLLAVSSTPFAASFLDGQWDTLLLLGLTVGYLFLMRGREGWAGLLLGITIFIAKPHLFLGLLVFLAFRGGKRLWGSMILGLGIVVAASLALSPSLLPGFVSSLFQSASVTPPAMSLGTTGWFASLMGSTDLIWEAGVLDLILLGICAAAGWQSRQGKLEVLFSLALMGSLLVSPHLLAQDLALLILPFLILARWFVLPARANLAGVVLLFAVAVGLEFATRQDIGTATAGFPGRLTPWVLLVAVLLLGVYGFRVPGRQGRAMQPAGAT